MRAPPLFATAVPPLRNHDLPDRAALLRLIRTAHREHRSSKSWRQVAPLFRALDTWLPLDGTTSLSTNTVEFSTDNPPPELLATVTEIAERLISWRTGPFQICGVELDAEWVSAKKWDRIHPHIPRLPGLVVGDVGCGNGYFLFRLQEFSPSLTIGFDPIDRCVLQFALLQRFLQVPNTAFIPCGIGALPALSRTFDLLICMGVLYHQRDPFTAVKLLFDALKPGGTLILESLTVPVDGPFLFVPPGRYAKMRNAWHIPSAQGLAAIAEQVGFADVQIFRHGALTIKEQRSTRFAPYESLADFLDKTDSSKTVEGHPAPHSAVVVGRRKR